jgi:PAS domain S-box-containing protein
MSERQEIARAALEEVLRQMPTRVVVAEAPSGETILSNTEAQQWTQQVLGQTVPQELGEVAELYDSSDLEMYHPDGRAYEPDERPLIRSITDGEEVRGEEIIHRLADGTKRWSRHDSSPIYDEEGRIVAGIVVGYDITEQKRSEEQRAYHAHLLENIHDAVTATDERYIITAWNKGAEQMFGWTADEALGRRVYELIPTDYSDEQLEEALRELSETGQRRSEGLRYRKDGTPVYAEALTIALRGEQGEITGYLGIHRDITEQKRAEVALKESHRRTENILERITDEFFVLDRGWRYVYINEPGLDRIREAKSDGLLREDILGKNTWELYPEFVGSVFYEELQRALREQETVAFEAHSALSDKWFEVRAYPSEEGLAIYSQDITERRRAREELETRLRQQAVVAGMGLRELEHNDLQLLMDDAVVLVAETLRVEYSKVVERLAGGEEVLVRAGVGWEEGVVGSVTPLVLQTAYTLRSNEPVIVEDLGAEERFEPAPRLVKHGVVSCITVVIPGREGPFGSLGAHSRRRRTFSEDDANFLQAVANVLATAVERKQAEEEIQRRTHQQAIVADLGLRALAETNVRALMDEAVALVARTLEVEYSKIVELLPGGEELLLRAGVGWRKGLVGEATETASLGSQAGYTLVSKEAVIVEDMREETRFRPPPLLVEHGVVSSMTVVISATEGPFGVLGVHTATQRIFSEDDINFLQAVANVLATAIERQGEQERVEKVREAERSRIARDLHDDALQDLSGALADAQLLLGRSVTEDPDAARLAEGLLASLDRIGPRLRAVIYDLTLEGEQERSFSELLEALVELQRTIVPEWEISLQIQDGLPPGPLGKTGKEILRIVREALINARRHSGAKHVRVRVWTSEGKFYAEVEDDGGGFDPAQEPSASTMGGIGTRGMGERAQLVGGELKIESEPGEGTRVRFELPLREDEEEPEGEEVHILLVEDHASIREALASTFEGEGFEVVGQAGSIAEARGMLEERQHPIDVAVLDLGLPDGYGADLIKELHEKNPQAQALVLSASFDRANIARAVELGAAGVLSKTAHLDEVVQAVRRLRAGEALMPLEEVVGLLRFAGSQREQEYEARQAIEKLTPREIEVLQALAEGLDSEGIAEMLHIALRTERNHMASILKKLEVHSQLQALVFALRHGVVEVP